MYKSNVIALDKVKVSLLASTDRENGKLGLSLQVDNANGQTIDMFEALMESIKAMVTGST